jgi:hypothetical protein
MDIPLAVRGFAEVNAMYCYQHQFAIAFFDVSTFKLEVS